MAPELFLQNQEIYSYESDLWSFGCILFEMVEGKPPYQSSSLNELMTNISCQATPKIENASPELMDLIYGLLEKVYAVN
jgi:serine/threonine protein kinase